MGSMDSNGRYTLIYHMVCHLSEGDLSKVGLEIQMALFTGNILYKQQKGPCLDHDILRSDPGNLYRDIIIRVQCTATLEHVDPGATIPGVRTLRRGSYHHDDVKKPSGTQYVQ